MAFRVLDRLIDNQSNIYTFDIRNPLLQEHNYGQLITGTQSTDPDFAINTYPFYCTVDSGQGVPSDLSITFEYNGHSVRFFWQGMSTQIFVDNQSIGTVTNFLSTYWTDRKIALSILVEDDTQICNIVGASWGYDGGTTYYYEVIGQTGYEAQYKVMYEVLTNSVPSSYNWISVPSVSGKNGILYALSTLTDINDGDPITTSDTTKFSLSPTTNVDTLVQNALNDG